MAANWVLLAVVIVAVGVFTAAVAIAAMALAMLKPERMREGRAILLLGRLSPGDLGLRFDPCQFKVIDEHRGRPLRIAGWWIPCPAARGRAVILVHGYGDAKVGSIAWAPLFFGLGFNILAIDLRAHGDSDGRFSTAGFWERHDLAQVIDQLRAEWPDETRQLVLFGISLGAAVVAATGAGRDDLSAVILESPYADYRHAIDSHAHRTGMPGPLLVRAATALAQRLSGAVFDEVRPVAMIERIAAPLMVIQSGDDPLVTAADAAALQEAVASRPPNRGPSIMWVVPEVPHVLAMCAHPELYRRQIEEFLHAALAPAAASATSTSSTGASQTLLSRE